MVPLRNMSMEQPEGTSLWSEVWDGVQSVVAGHAVHSLEAPRVDRNAHGAEVWSIDTGAVFGGNLTALVLETREVIQVRASRAWASRSSATSE